MRSDNSCVRSEPPHITTQSRSGEVLVGVDINVAVGGRVALRCDVTGYPEPSRTWTVANGLPVNSTAQIETQENGAVLVISNASTIHSKRYTCTAKNRAGEASKSSVVTVANCVSSVRHFPHPKCVVTVLLLEETAYVQSVFALWSSSALVESLLQQLEEELINRSIGVEVRNRYGVVAFGSKLGPRVLQAGSPLADLFGVNDVGDAVRQLRSDSTSPDVYQAIVHALTKIEMQNVTDKCLISVVLATTTFRQIVKINKNSLKSSLCKRQPVIVNSLLNVRFTTTTSRRWAMGVDWMGNVYITPSRSDAVVSRERVQFSPASYSVCNSMSVYGQLSLDFHGGVWDITHFHEMKNALVNATLLSISQISSCEECLCSKTEPAGQLCTHIKNPNYCQCRNEGKTVLSTSHCCLSIR